MADYGFEAQLRDRLSRYRHDPSAIPISIKIRDKNRRCMGACCWPEVHQEIERIRREHVRDQHPTAGTLPWHLEYHETGPELIVLVSAGLTLAAGLINFATAVINAYSIGRSRRGERADLEVTVRGFDNDDKFFDHVLTSVTVSHKRNTPGLENAILKAIKPHIDQTASACTSNETKPPPSKKTVSKGRRQSPKKSARKNK